MGAIKLNPGQLHIQVEQARELYIFAKECGYSRQAVHEIMLRELGYTTAMQLTVAQYHALRHTIRNTPCQTST